MRLEYFEDLASQTPRVLLTYGDDPSGATSLRQAVEALAGGAVGHEVRVDRLPGFEGLDGCSLVATVGTSDRGVEPLDGAWKDFRCVLGPAAWENVAGLLEPFETRTPDHAHQYLDESGPVLWIVSSDRGW